jgi:RHS repeat-associated protein
MEPYRDIDEEGNITGYVYDDRGNMTVMQKPDGSLTHYLYDGSGRLQMTTDAEGNSLVYVYKENLLIAIINEDQSVNSYEYNDAGLVKMVSNNEGQRTYFEYDQDHNLNRLRLADSNESRWEYDSWGRCIQTINPEKQTQLFSYDLLDRVIKIKKYDNNQVELRYDAYENVVYAEDAHQRVKFEYTPFGNLKVREENGTRVQFNYNTEGRMISLMNENNQLYRFRYDDRGNIKQEIGFDGLKRDYIRDRAGKVIKVERPGNKFTEYEYDPAGRISRMEYSDGTWQIFSCDLNGQLISAENETGTVILKRDAAGRIISEQQGEYAVDSKYDKLGRRSEITSTLGASIKIARNERGRISLFEAANKEGSHWGASYKYNALGLEVKRFLPGDIVSSFEYNHNGYASGHKITNGLKTIRNRQYSWSVSDRLQTMMNNVTNGLVQYGHDDFGNLAWARYEDGQYDHRLPDEVGNLYKTKDRGGRKYGAGGRLLESNGTKYNYDDEGNLISKTSHSGKQWLYEWAGNGMLKKVSRPDGKEVCFEYDALGRRTAKTYNGTITRWVWDGNTPLHEWNYPVKERPKTIVDEFGEVIKDKTEPADAIISWIFDEGSLKPCAKLDGQNNHSIITDYLGTPVEMYDSGGGQRWNVEYDIYGKIRKQDVGHSNDCPFRYQGQYEDAETGLYYNRFRYYNPDEGIYISQDPVRLKGGMNLYSYVYNVNACIDPFGLGEQPRTPDGKFAPKNPGDTCPGADAVAAQKAAFEADPNYVVRGEEISFRDSDGQLRRYDLVVEDVKTGDIVGVEVKASQDASYGKAQKTFDAKVGTAEGGVHPVGAKAQEAGITKIDKVQVIRCK